MQSGTQPLEEGTVTLANPDAGRFLSVSGFSDVEVPGRWSDGPAASVTFQLPASVDGVVAVRLEFGAFIVPRILDSQIVRVSVNGARARDANGAPAREWTVRDAVARTRQLLIDVRRSKTIKTITLDLTLPNCASPKSLNINPDPRRLGIMLRRVGWQALKEVPPPEDWIWQLGREVGGEARKTFDHKIESGFWSRFINGPNVLDVGFRGYLKEVVPITPTAIGIDLDYPGYDGKTLPFEDNSQDAVYASHCLEHILDYAQVISEWHRVTRVGGHIITIVPHAYLYERSLRPPSQWNNDHKRVYTPASLLHEFENALRPNSYRVRLLEDNDLDYRYQDAPDEHPAGCYEIMLVVQKIQAPLWEPRK
jgi:hypothetical protein